MHTGLEYQCSPSPALVHACLQVVLISLHTLYMAVINVFIWLFIIHFDAESPESHAMAQTGLNLLV